MLKKFYYYRFHDINDLDFLPYSEYATSLEDILDSYGQFSESLPIDPNDENIQALWERLVARYYDDPLFRIEKLPNESVSNSEMLEAFKNWLIRFVNKVAQTQEYYLSLLTAYTNAQADLMADIKATSKNQVSFNDTPQNTNVSGAYEGDNYITHFTKTSGETSSPLMSKIMRLKEIQDHYKNVMGDWVQEMQFLFIEEANNL